MMEQVSISPATGTIQEKGTQMEMETQLLLPQMIGSAFMTIQGLLQIPISSPGQIYSMMNIENDYK
jgi:hypothetical protein